MTTKHTPTPWIVIDGILRHNSNSDADCVQIAEITHSPLGLDWDGCRTRAVGLEESNANAAFIARACNSHDALISALQGVVDNLSQNKTFPADVENAKRLAVNALAKAKGDA